MAEFRRAQAELKTTFDRELKNLERETGINELVATTYQAGSYDYESSKYEPSHYEGSYVSAINPDVDTPAINSTLTTPVTSSVTNGASALQGAGSTTTLQLQAASGSIASGQLGVPHYEPAPAAAEAPAGEHSVVEHNTAETVHG